MTRDEEFIRHLLNELSLNRWAMRQLAKTYNFPILFREVEILDGLIKQIKEHLTTPSNHDTLSGSTP